MDLKLDVDAKAVLRQLDGAAKQLPFTLSLAVNTTLLEAQAKQRAMMPSRFDLKAPNARQAFEKAIKLEKSTRKELQGSLSIGGPQPSKTFERVAKMVLRQEEGGTHKSAALYRGQNGQMHAGGFFLPTDTLRGKVIPRYLYPRALGVQARRGVDGTMVGFAGSVKGRGKRFAHKTSFYTIPVVGIFRREHTGSGEEETAVVWWFKQSITLKPRLLFVDTVQQIIRLRYEPNVAIAVERALRPAR